MNPILPPDARAWREIDLDALAHNARALQSRLAPDCRLMAVVKADAYGHGAVPVARRLRREGVNSFAVACLSEALELRRHGIGGQILILGYTPPDQAPLLSLHHLIQTVADEEHGLALAARGIPLRVHLALDTGMHRLGIPARDLPAIARMYRLSTLRIEGVFSHLCVADSPLPQHRAYTAGQLKLFYDTLERMRGQGLCPGQTHIQASYGIWNLPPQPCSLARPGIALYGVASDDPAPARDMGLRPVLALRARIASVRTLPAGQGAGYGLDFRPDTPRRLAAVTIGYADGLPRSLPGQGGQVLIAGRRCLMVGRMCMDQLLADVTDVPEAAAGDVVTLIGSSGPEEIRAEAVALSCGTITNELLSRMGARLPLVVSPPEKAPSSEE